MAKPLNRTIVERARALIANEKDWCRGVLARDHLGDAVDPTDPNASRRCAYGALVAAAYELVRDVSEAHNLAVGAARANCCCSSLIGINDHFGHAAVLELFDKALRDAR
jgi:hypothetical protein